MLTQCTLLNQGFVTPVLKMCVWLHQYHEYLPHCPRVTCTFADDALVARQHIS